MSDELQFSQVWDGSNLGIDLPDIWDRIRIFTCNPEKILEVGSFEGFSACKMIELFSRHNPINLTCIDTWEGMICHDDRVGADDEALFHRNLEIARRDTPHPVTLRTLKMDSYLALSSLICQGEAGTFDWIYLDASHEAQDVLADAVAAFKLLKSGGILIFDDYAWSDPLFKGGHINNTPKPAIDAFVNIYFDKITMLSGAPLYQMYLRKK